MSNLISKFLSKSKKEDVVHTSAYGIAQNEGGIGVASVQSFGARMQIEKNRNKVRGYNDSRVVAQAKADSGVKAKVYTPPENKDSFMEKRNGTDTVKSVRPIKPQIRPGFMKKK